MDKSRYKIYYIPGANGKRRKIEEPDAELKSQQTNVLRWLRDFQVRHTPYAHGSILGRSVVTNASPHVGKSMIVKFDLKNFFPGIGSAQVKSALYGENIPLDRIKEILDICLLEHRLPQGAPTSPILANLVAKRLDFSIVKWLNREFPHWQPAYTRYVDDLTISANISSLNGIRRPIQSIVEYCGFTLNHKKTRFLRNRRKQVAGIVVNEKLSTPRTMRKRLRAMFHQIKKDLFSDTNIESIGERYQKAQGLLSHVHGVNSAQAKAYEKICHEIDLLLRLRTVAAQ